MGYLDRLLRKATQTAESHGLVNHSVSVTVRALTPREAIGRPNRDDFPILKGKEVMIEASVDGWRGHAFTDEPRPFQGTLGEALSLEMDRSAHRAIAVAVSNALAAIAGLTDRTVHCRDDGPRLCAERLGTYLQKRFGDGLRFGLVGLNPALLAALVGTFGPDRVSVTDLDPDNVGSMKMGVPVLHGIRDLDALLERSDVLLVTGTTLVNGTFDGLMSKVGERPVILYGVTAASLAAFLGFERWCPESFPSKR